MVNAYGSVNVHTLLAMPATLIRLLRPSRGLHAAPRVLRREVREEARAALVRRYANPLPARPAGPGYASALPAPRRPLDTTPPVTLRLDSTNHAAAARTGAVSSPVDLAYEARQRHENLDRDRWDAAVLRGTAVLEGAA